MNVEPLTLFIPNLLSKLFFWSHATRFEVLLMFGTDSSLRFRPIPENANAFSDSQPNQWNLGNFRGEK